MTLPFFADLPLLIVKQNPSDRSLEYKIFYHSTLVLCHLCKTGKIKDKKTQDSQVIRSFYVHHPVSGFYKAGITSNAFAISKMFSYLQHTEKKKHKPLWIIFPFSLPTACWQFKHGPPTGEEERRTALCTFFYLPPPNQPSTPTPTSPTTTPTLLAVQTWSTNWRTALHNFIYLPPPMITRLPADLAQQLPALVQRTTCLLMCHWDY